MPKTILFDSYKLGSLTLKNRVVMAPMTRNRSANNVPDHLVAEYYGQRAEAGLIITEGTSPSPNGLGYARIPGLFNEEHVKAWHAVTDKVHAGKSHIFVQLMHCGRASHPDNLPAKAKIIAPSAIALGQDIWTDTKGNQPAPVPEAMSEKEIEDTIHEFVKSADLAVKSGFDGVEIHGANGYLVDQFLNTAANQRTDRWGGTIENRARFPLEIAKQMAKKIGPEKVGIRLSPYGAFNSTTPDAEMDRLYEYLAKELSTLGIAYIHVVDHSSMGAPAVPDSVKKLIRSNFKGTYILSGGYDKKTAEADLDAKKGDIVAFGRPFISNPRLVSKMLEDAPLTPADQTTFYTPGPKGFTDYPVN